MKTREFEHVEPCAELRITTHKPTKWLAIDMETGDIWKGTAKEGVCGSRGSWVVPPSEDIKLALRLIWGAILRGVCK